ncbi:hypothetical protein GCM10028786_12240 [Flaviaesturariibacter terrae]
MCIQPRDFSGKALGVGHVVGMHNRDIIAYGYTQTIVGSRYHATVLAAIVRPYAFIVVAGNNGTGRIRAAILNEDELPIGERLLYNAVDRFPKESSGVVHRHNNTYTGHIGTGSVADLQKYGFSTALPLEMP